MILFYLLYSLSFVILYDENVHIDYYNKVKIRFRNLHHTTPELFYEEIPPHQ